LIPEAGLRLYCWRVGDMAKPNPVMAVNLLLRQVASRRAIFDALNVLLVSRRPNSRFGAAPVIVDDYPTTISW
jgi:hypothetical protein